MQQNNRSFQARKAIEGMMQEIYRPGRISPLLRPLFGLSPIIRWSTTIGAGNQPSLGLERIWTALRPMKMVRRKPA